MPFDPLHYLRDDVGFFLPFLQDLEICACCVLGTVSFHTSESHFPVFEVVFVPFDPPLG